MTTPIFSSVEAHKFIKVEKFFERYKEWERLGPAVSHAFDEATDSLTVNFTRADGRPCAMLIEFPREDAIRVRFNPARAGGYPTDNTRSVTQESFAKLKRMIRLNEGFTVSAKDAADRIELTSTGSDQSPVLKVLITHQPFSIQVFDASQGEPVLVWRTADIPIYFTPNGEEDYAIIQAVDKPAGAKYFGFGEQGGQCLAKNNHQVSYFNFDNMRYRQVYDRGPLDPREPLYHSDPVFFEFNGLGGSESVDAVFIDNPSQILMDIGYLNSGRYMFGTRFGDLDYYLFIGRRVKDIVTALTSVIGRSRLKPRYILGYHQGCYGYERREIVEWAVSKYRDYQIPLDGIHVDVDIQHRYQTFTIDTDKFPDPQGMFRGLRERGVKCSTNITPVISREDPGYSTFVQARDQGYFVLDTRYAPDDPDSKVYQLYGGGNEYSPNNGYVEGFDSGQPYIGGVYYGNDASGQELGASGHYADLGRKEVRDWWGTQYQYLFDMGLEMVWQDMTTPAIRDYRGDMKGFPFRLNVTDDFLGDGAPHLSPAIKVWNLYSYNLHKATYLGLNALKGRENKRNFIIGRGSFTGSHCFSGLWTGDNASDWDFLQMNVSQALSLGLCGVVINGQDIGGFETSMDGGSWASPELLIRWTTAGAFLPWFRNHYVRKGRKEFQEPFMYVEWFDKYRGGQLPEPQDLYRMVLPICKHYIELRYRLLQLFYDAMFENTLTGLPICCPLFLHADQDKSLYSDKDPFVDNEFFVGKDLLVAPVLWPQIRDGYDNKGKRDVYLPAGSNWYCFTDNAQPLGPAIEGGTTVCDFDANLNIEGDHIRFIVPVYVREGAVFPMIELEQYVGELNERGLPRPITLNIYPGAQGSYSMYLDDGVSRSSADPDSPPVAFGGDPQAKGEYRQTQISHAYKDAKTREIKIERVHDNYTPPLEKHLFVAILHDPSEASGASGCLRRVTLNGQEVRLLSGGSPEQRADDLKASPDAAWYYNENIRVSFVKVPDDAPAITLVAEYS